MTTAVEMAAAVGTTRLLRVDGFLVQIKILDARSVYGQTQYQVIPVAGYGVRWINASSLRRED